MLSDRTTTIRTYGPRLAGTGTRARSLDRRHRARGRSPSSDRRLLGAQAPPVSHARIQARRAVVDSIEPRLRSLVDRGLSIREIAAECGRSPATVRHWLRRFGLQTQPARYAPRGSRHALVCECHVHGWSDVPAHRLRRLPLLRVPCSRRTSRAGVGASRRFSSPRRGEPVGFAATTVPRRHSSSTTSILLRSGSRSLRVASRARSRMRARRPESACYCARTATRRWKADTVGCRNPLGGAGKRSGVAQRQSFGC